MQEIPFPQQSIMRYVNRRLDCSNHNQNNIPGEDDNECFDLLWILGKNIRIICTNIGLSAQHLLQCLTNSSYRSIKDMKIIVVSILFPLIIMPLVVLSIVKAIRDWTIFPLQRRYGVLGPSDRHQPPANLRRFQLTVQSRQHRLTGYLLPPAIEHKGTIVFFHSSRITAHQAVLLYGNPWRQAGYCTIFATYPGYGGSEGAILSGDDLVEAGQAFVDFAKRLPQGSSAQGLILWGWSTGTGIAMRLAADNADDVSRVILHAPYYSLDAFAQWETDGFCESCTRYLHYQVDTHQDLQRFVQNPEKKVILIHNTRDSFVPFEQSEQLFQPYLEPSVEQTATGQRNVHLLKLIPQINDIHHCSTCNYTADLTILWHAYLPHKWKVKLLTRNDIPTSPRDILGQP